MNIKLNINQKELEKAILNEVKKKVVSSIPRIANSINNQLPALIKRHLTAGVAPITGNDFYEIGVPDVNERLVEIIDVASRSFKVEVIPANLLKINLGILDTDYSYLFDLPEAYFTYTSKNGNGILKWLEWILLEGNSPIVDGFDFKLNNSRFSRTGGGLMVNGTTWNVPPSLQGTREDNLLTRALVGLEKDLEALVKQVLNTSIK